MAQTTPTDDFIDALALSVELSGLHEQYVLGSNAGYNAFSYAVQATLETTFTICIAARRAAGMIRSADAMSELTGDIPGVAAAVAQLVRERARERRRRAAQVHVLQEGEEWWPMHNAEGLYAPSRLDLMATHEQPWRDSLELTHLAGPRAAWALRDAGIESLYDVSLRTDADLLAVKGVGPKTVQRLRQRIAELEEAQPLVPEGVIQLRA